MAIELGRRSRNLGRKSGQRVQVGGVEFEDVCCVEGRRDVIFGGVALGRLVPVTERNFCVVSRF